MNVELYVTGGSIAFAGWLIAKAIGDGLQRIADKIENNGHLVHRVGTKLDALWSPISGLNNAAWQLTPDPAKRFEVDYDD